MYAAESLDSPITSSQLLPTLLRVCDTTKAAVVLLQDLTMLVATSTTIFYYWEYHRKRYVH